MAPKNTLLGRFVGDTDLYMTCTLIRLILIAEQCSVQCSLQLSLFEHLNMNFHHKILRITLNIRLFDIVVMQWILAISCNFILINSKMQNVHKTQLLSKEMWYYFKGFSRVKHCYLFLLAIMLKFVYDNLNFSLFLAHPSNSLRNI